jgi:excisionase family DNA binding protein
LALQLQSDEIFLTTEEVLAYLQVNLRTVYRLIKAGKIPAVRVGRQWRFRKRDIDAWLDTQRTHGPSPISPTSSPMSHNGYRRVLVVDDEPNIREMLRKTLSIEKYDVETAPDADAALARLRDTSFDLLIADLKMPGMDGLSLIKQVKQLRANMPVIIITGFSTESAAIEAVNLGVQGYLTKPVGIPQVLAAARKALDASAA